MNKECQKLHEILTKRRFTLATAESCTGGLLGSLLTSTPGSSKYFKLGVIAYSNKAKQILLKLPGSLIKTKGAVSREVAAKMAQNVKRLAGTDIGVGITGIAGPSGGTTQKPVGTVYIAAALKNKTICMKSQFKGGRDKIRKLSALTALKLIAETLS